MEENIKRVIDESIKPMLAMHLGALDYVGFTNGVVSVRFQGMCRGCELSNLTLKAGIEAILKEKIPGVERVEAVE